MLKIYGTAMISFLFIFTGCGNIFSAFDSPSGDAQLIAAARACFDQGNFACAAKNYHLLELSTNPTTLNQAYSEDAFEILAQNGLTFDVFMTTVINSAGSAGTLINTLAGILRTNATVNPLASGTYATRQAFFTAYQKSISMSSGRSQGLIQFITATALLSEILAEDATGIDSVNKVGILKQSDLVTDPTTCLASQGNYPWDGCLPPTGATIVDGSSALTLSTATVAELSTPPNLQMVLAASSVIQTGFTQLTHSAGGISSSTASLAGNLIGLAIGTPAGSPLFRYTLIKLGIGVK